MVLSLVLGVHLLPLALDHVHVGVSCNLSALTMPFTGSHFLHRVERSGALVAPLICVLVGDV